MAITTTFTVKNSLSVDTTNHVLVFLKPVKASKDFQYVAWQDLNPVRNGTQAFDYVIDLGVQVGDADSGNPPGPLSPIYPINPGELFSVTNPNNQGPYIQSSVNVNAGEITSAQAGIRNDCVSPITGLSLSWTNAGQAVVNVGVATNDIINQGKIVTLELEPTLYFMAADPTMYGPNFTLQDFSMMTPYTLTAGQTAVNVEWTRGNNGLGKDVFNFSTP
jgi:hypothetical protein